MQVSRAGFGARVRESMAWIAQVSGDRYYSQTACHRGANSGDLENGRPQDHQRAPVAHGDFSPTSKPPFKASRRTTNAGRPSTPLISLARYSPMIPRQN